MIDSLPTKIKNDCLSVIYEKLIEGNKFFQDKPVEFVGLMAPKLKFYRFDANDFIYSINEVASEMYFIVKGEVALSLKNTENRMINFRIRTPGQHFGEVDMMMNRDQLHTDYAKALTNCELLAILNDDLQSVLRKFDEHMEVFLQATAVRQIRYNEDKEELMRANSGVWEVSESPLALKNKPSFYEQVVGLERNPSDIQDLDQ